MIKKIVKYVKPLVINIYNAGGMGVKYACCSMLTFLIHIEFASENSCEMEGENACEILSRFT